MSKFLSALKKFSLPTPSDISHDISAYIREAGPWYAGSAAAHAVVFLILMMVLGAIRYAAPPKPDVPDYKEADKTAVKEKKEEVPEFKLDDTPLEPTRLDNETLTMTEPIGQVGGKEDIDDLPYEPAGGGIQSDVKAPNFGGFGGFKIKAKGTGPSTDGLGGVGVGIGFGDKPGSGGSGSGFGLRGHGHKGIPGVTAASEKAVAAALRWLAFHQDYDGHWSLDNFNPRCKDNTCTGPGKGHHDAAATAMGVLPFLGAGQTHQQKCVYQENVGKALQWLVSHQQPDGNLCSGSSQVMYSHGLATIALCEAFGMTQDSRIGGAAENAIKFIQAAQNKTTGGWRYKPQMEGDTSVFGWQIMALRSGQLSGIQIDPAVYEGCHKWLDSVSKGGEYGGVFSYQAGQRKATETMTAVGCLGLQYLGAPKGSPALREGEALLMQNLPGDGRGRNFYYWYYATQVMHNMNDAEWQTWNRQVRKSLIEGQVKIGCATGSWDPDKDAWGNQGGRVMLTSLGALTLEVYYRYLPLYKLDKVEVPNEGEEKAKPKPKPKPVENDDEPKDDKELLKGGEK